VSWMQQGEALINYGKDASVDGVLWRLATRANTRESGPKGTEANQ